MQAGVPLAAELESLLRIQTHHFIPLNIKTYGLVNPPTAGPVRFLLHRWGHNNGHIRQQTIIFGFYDGDLLGQRPHSAFALAKQRILICQQDVGHGESSWIFKRLQERRHHRSISKLRKFLPQRISSVTPCVYHVIYSRDVNVPSKVIIGQTLNEIACFASIWSARVWQTHERYLSMLRMDRVARSKEVKRNVLPACGREAPG